MADLDNLRDPGGGLVSPDKESDEQNPRTGKQQGDLDVCHLVDQAARTEKTSAREDEPRCVWAGRGRGDGLMGRKLLVNDGGSKD